MFPMNYGYELPEEVWGMDKLIMVDFSLKRELMEHLHAAFGENFIWIDHHGPAIKEMEDIGIWGLRTVGYAACELVWDYFQPITVATAGLQMPEMIELLGRYDVWDQRDMTRWKEEILPFQYGMRNHDTDPRDHYQFWKLIFDRFKRTPYQKAVGAHFEFITKIQGEGRTILSYQAKQDEKYMKAYAFEGVFEHEPALVVNRGMNNSRAFGSRYDPLKHAFMVSYVRRRDGGYTVSIYSDKEHVHCGQIAQGYGGGGHKGAAGFHTDTDPIALGIIGIR